MTTLQPPEEVVSEVFQVLQTPVVDNSIVKQELIEYCTRSNNVRNLKTINIEGEPEDLFINLSEAYLRTKVYIENLPSFTHKTANPTYVPQGVSLNSYYSRMHAVSFTPNLTHLFRSATLVINDKVIETVTDPGAISTLYDIVHKDYASNRYALQNTPDYATPEIIRANALSRFPTSGGDELNIHRIAVNGVDASLNPGFQYRNGQNMDTYDIPLVQIFPFLRAYNRLMRILSFRITLNKNSDEQILTRDSVTTGPTLNNPGTIVPWGSDIAPDVSGETRYVANLAYLRQCQATPTHRYVPTTLDVETSSNSVLSSQAIENDTATIAEMSLWVPAIDPSEAASNIITPQLLGGTSSQLTWNPSFVDYSPVYNKEVSDLSFIFRSIADPIVRVSIGCIPARNRDSMDHYKTLFISNFITHVEIFVNGRRFPKDGIDVEFSKPVSFTNNIVPPKQRANYIDLFQRFLAAGDHDNEREATSALITAEEFDLYYPIFVIDVDPLLTLLPTNSVQTLKVVIRRDVPDPKGEGADTLLNNAIDKFMFRVLVEMEKRSIVTGSNGQTIFTNTV